MAEFRKESQGNEEPQVQAIVGTMPYRISMSEVDAYGALYHSRIFEIFEKSRTELLRALGIEISKAFRERQILFPVIEVACRFLAPIPYDELVVIETAITNIAPNAIRFDYRVLKDNNLLAMGFSQHIFIDPQGNPVNYGQEIFEELKQKGVIKEGMFEAQGQPSAPPSQPEDVKSKLTKIISERLRGGDGKKENPEGNS